FVVGAGDALCLYSFPTRRSSDLGARFCGQVRVLIAPGLKWACLCRQCLDQFESEPIAGHAAQQTGAQQAVEAGADFLLRRLPDLDRKSTRLNSSHVKISYAVFCL